MIQLKKLYKDLNILFIILILFIMVLVFSIGMPFYVYLSALFAILCTYALAYNVIYGYAGLISFGHALFFAASAYGFALSAKYIEEPLISILIGLAFSVLIAYIVGIFTLKTSRIYFAMLTLAFGMLFWATLIKWRDITGGSDGIAGFVKKSLLIDLEDPAMRYFFIVLVFGITLFFFYMFHKSKLGLLLRALGSNEELIPFTGHSIFKLRMLAFLISGFFSGLAGILYAIYFDVVTPDIAYWTHSAEPLIMTLLGGAGTLGGPIIGALIMVTLTTIVARFYDIWQLILGLLLAVLILWFRGGIIGSIIRIWKKE